MINEGILMGIKKKNNRKVHCRRGHVLPPKEMIDGKMRRICRICVEINRYNNNGSSKAYSKLQAIRNSKFPLVTYLTGESR